MLVTESSRLLSESSTAFMLVRARWAIAAAVSPVWVPLTMTFQQAMMLPIIIMNSAMAIMISTSVKARVWGRAGIFITRFRTSFLNRA